MSNEQIDKLADAVADRLASSDKLATSVAANLNGQLSGIREDVAALKSDMSEVKTAVSETPARWTTCMAGSERWMSASPS